MELKPGRFLKVLGLLISLACCVFVGKELFSRREFLAQSPGWSLFPAVVLGTSLWISVNICLGLGWRHLVGVFGNRLSYRDSIGLSLQTQIAKYLPGNVFHHLGRTVLAKRHGVPLAVAGSATILEALFLVSVAMLFGISFLVREGLLVIALGMAASLIVTLGFIFTNPNRFPFLFGPSRPSPGQFLHWGKAGVFYAAVMVLQALMFFVFTWVMPLVVNFDFLELLEMVSITWAAGFVVIGAPGGLGVREAVYSAFSSSPDLHWQLLYIASWMRVSSILGDTISFFISGYFLKLPSERSLNE